MRGRRYLQLSLVTAVILPLLSLTGCSSVPSSPLVSVGLSPPGHEPSTEAQLPSNSPVAGTSFVEVASSVFGTQVLFKDKRASSQQVVSTAEAASKSVSNGGVLNAGVWVDNLGRLTVDLGNPDTFSYPTVIRKLTADGANHGDSLEATYEVLESVYSASELPPTVGDSGVEVLAPPASSPGASDLEAEGATLVEALAQMGATYVIVQLVTVLQPDGYVWRVIALGPGLFDTPTSVGRTVFGAFGASIGPSDHVATGIALVGSTATSESL